MVLHVGAHRSPYTEPSTDLCQPTKPRKQACLACRRRKKRCDGNRPACAACSGWQLDCVYASVSQTPSNYGFRTPNSPPGIDLGPFVQNIPITPFDFSLGLSPLSSETNDGGSLFHSPMTGDPSWPLSQNLSTPPLSPMPPSPEQIIQLVAEFFQQSHPKFPCIYKETFLDQLRGPQGPVLSTPLEWAILATAARAHRDTTISSQADMFLQVAADSLTQSPLLRENVLRDLQAAVWCVFSLYYSGEITKAVVLLAQAYSLACLNGLNKLDDPNPNIPRTIQFSPIQEEECRGTLWALFLLDRHINYLMGRYFVIDDTQWCVNYPLDDWSLQHRLHPHTEPYNRDLAALALEQPNIPLGVSLTRLMHKASVMLGRIVTYKSINPMPTDTEGAHSRLSVFHELQSALASFWVSLPACVHNVAEVPPESVDQSVWLLITLHTCSTLLFHITAVERRSPGGDSLPSERENFVCSYKSVNKVVTALRQISGLVIDAVSNPILASSYFMCCRFILVQWHLTQQQSYQLDLNLILKLLARMAEKQAQMPRIYKDIIEQELGRGRQAEANAGQALMRTGHCFTI